MPLVPPDPHQHNNTITATTHFLLGSAALQGLGLLIIEASRSHSDTPQSVRILWTSDHPVAETSPWQHTTFTRDRH